MSYDYTSSESLIVTVWFLKYPIIALVSALLILKFVALVRKFVFRSFYAKSTRILWESVAGYKRDLFEKLKTDEKLNGSDGKAIRLLEVGVGPGINFQFYPEHARLTLLEPNEFFLKEIHDNLSKYPKLQLDRLIVGVGEDLSKLEDNSVDVVVETSVLCSVKDVGQVLNEIRRVLVPGGYFLFLEHGYGVREWWLWLVQLVVEPFWELFTNHCKLSLDTIQDIRDGGFFTDVQYKAFWLPHNAPLLFRILQGQFVYGTARKPLI